MAQLIAGGVEVAIMTEQEAELALANNSITVNGFTQELLADSVQFLALGGVSLSRVVGTGLAAAQADGGFRSGVTYDAFNTDLMAYGKKLAQLCSSVNRDTVITDSMIKALGKSLPTGRVQMEFMSDLIDEVVIDMKTGEPIVGADGNALLTGRQYFQVIKRDHQVTTDRVSDYRDRSKVKGITSHIELFVEDLSKGIFKDKDGNQVRLGHAAVYDWFKLQIEQTGSVQLFEAVLNTAPALLIRALHQKGDTRFTFMTVFSTIKDRINPVA